MRTVLSKAGYREPRIELTQTMNGIQRAVDEIEANNIRWLRAILEWIETTKKENEVWRSNLLDAVNNRRKDMMEKITKTEGRTLRVEKQAE